LLIAFKSWQRRVCNKWKGGNLNETHIYIFLFFLQSFQCHRLTMPITQIYLTIWKTKRQLLQQEVDFPTHSFRDNFTRNFRNQSNSTWQCHPTQNRGQSSSQTEKSVLQLMERQGVLDWRSTSLTPREI
jgi:hypothetical protein